MRVKLVYELPTLALAGFVAPDWGLHRRRQGKPCGRHIDVDGLLGLGGVVGAQLGLSAPGAPVARILAVTL
jgi:hypothetical protein